MQAGAPTKTETVSGMSFLDLVFRTPELKKERVDATFLNFAVRDTVTAATTLCDIAQTAEADAPVASAQSKDNNHEGDVLEEMPDMDEVEENDVLRDELDYLRATEVTKSSDNGESMVVPYYNGIKNKPKTQFYFYEQDFVKWLRQRSDENNDEYKELMNSCTVDVSVIDKTLRTNDNVLETEMIKETIDRTLRVTNPQVDPESVSFVKTLKSQVKRKTNHLSNERYRWNLDNFRVILYNAIGCQHMKRVGVQRKAGGPGRKNNPFKISKNQMLLEIAYAVYFLRSKCLEFKRACNDTAALKKQTQKAARYKRQRDFVHAKSKKQKGLIADLKRRLQKYEGQHSDCQTSTTGTQTDLSP